MPRSAKVRCFSDSQGRTVPSELRKNSSHKVYGVVKPGAKFDVVTLIFIKESIQKIKLMNLLSV